MVSASNYCAISKLLKILGTEWTAHLVLILAEQESIRHNQLKSQLPGISSKVLSDRLRLLEAEKFIIRREDPDVSNSVSYSLSAVGQTLHNALHHIEDVCEELKD